MKENKKCCMKCKNKTEQETYNKLLKIAELIKSHYDEGKKITITLLVMSVLINIIVIVKLFN